jgi:hypothetical protein
MQDQQTKRWDYSRHKINIAKYDDILSKMSAPFPMTLKSFAGCKTTTELSNLVGALFYVCSLGYLNPDHQKEFTVLDGWKPGDRLPAECEELLKERDV